MKLNLVRCFQKLVSQCDCPPGGLAICVDTLGGPCCSVLVDCACTVLDLKSSIEQASEVLASHQRLFSGKVELNDTDRLSELQMRTDITQILLVYRDPLQVEWLQQVREHVLLEQAPASIRDDREVVSEAVQTNGGQIQYASEELQADRALAMHAVKAGGGNVVQFLSEELRADRQFMTLALQHQRPYGALQSAADSLRNDKGFVIEAVRKKNQSFS